ncbi:hypothetical protein METBISCDRAFT_23240 [Metschnikowia bicuspidata]|uniref:Rhodanese domain-containing protein n=1 Tax=Metschnikowia bicuspidata TaxID=27322 RepID=A0A4P9ZCS1_9ASCO|nr:hypothetical protein METBISCDRAFT_23240 [Metschnikowia bicuspidata]
MSGLKPVTQWLDEYKDEVVDVPILRIPKEELLELLKKNPEQVAAVDLRNEIEEKGVIKKALHVPATVIDGAADVERGLLLVVLEQKPQAKQIVLFCNRSGLRPTYVGGWAKQHLEKTGLDVEVVILDGGITDWVTGGVEFQDETVYYSGA